MRATIARTRLTIDDLDALPDAKSYELLDGELVERAIGSESSWVGGELFGLLREICRPNRLGLLFGAEAGYRCFPGDPNRLRRPDISFIRAGKLPGERPSKGYETVVPDLVVEVLSPNDLASKVEAKIKEYVGVGVRLVWVINPETRDARVYRADRSVTWLSGDDELSGEDVVPGFLCKLSVLFPEPEAPTSSAGGA